jgi:hypothetical protein
VDSPFTEHEGADTIFRFAWVPRRMVRRLFQVCFLSVWVAGMTIATYSGDALTRGQRIVVATVGALLLLMCWGLLALQTRIDRLRAARGWIKTSPQGLESADWRGRVRALPWSEVQELRVSRRSHRGDPPLGSTLVVLGSHSRIVVADTAELPDWDTVVQLARGYAHLTHCDRRWVPFGAVTSYGREP